MRGPVVSLVRCSIARDGRLSYVRHRTDKGRHSVTNSVANFAKDPSCRARYRGAD